MNIIEELYEIERKNNSKEINTGQFCQLSKDKKFQSWLKEYNTAQYEFLINSLENSNSCKKNREMMMKIYNSIEKKELIEFLRKEFPQLMR
jgi:hypothetical protein